MNDFLKYMQQYAWVLGLIGTFTGLAIGLLISKRRLLKVLTCRTISDTRVLSSRHEKRQYQLLYGDKPVSNARIVEIELRNTGGKALEIKDFYKPITVEVPAGNEIITADVTRAPEHETMTVTMNSEKEKPVVSCTLSPVLMNPGERMRLTLVCSLSLTDEPKVYTKISDGTFRMYNPTIIMDIPKWIPYLMLPIMSVLIFTILLLQPPYIGVLRIVAISVLLLSSWAISYLIARLDILSKNY